MEIEITNEMKVCALLSEYANNIKSGKDQLEITLALAERIDKMYTKS